MNLHSVEFQISPTRFVRLIGLSLIQSIDLSSLFENFDVISSEDKLLETVNKKLVLIDCNKVMQIYSANEICECELALKGYDFLAFETLHVTGFQEYKSMFEIAKKNLDNGHINKIVLTILEEGLVYGDLDIKPFMCGDHRRFYKLDFDDLTFIGLSPDPFLDSVDLLNWRAHLVAGTSSDLNNIPSKELAQSEHDLSGGLEVRSRKEFVVDAGGLFHRQATFEFKPKSSIFEFISNAYPPSTIFGYPYQETRVLKDRINQVIPPWGSLLGYFGPLSDQLLFRSIILIRGMFLSDNRYRIIAGSGIIRDSLCDNEYRECLDKIQSVKKAFSAG